MEWICEESPLELDGMNDNLAVYVKNYIFNNSNNESIE